MIETGRGETKNTDRAGFATPESQLQQLRDERDEAVALLQEVRVAVLAFHNRAGILLVNSASSLKPPACHPYCLQQVCNSHGRVVAKAAHPAPAPANAPSPRSSGAGVATRPRGASAGGRGRPRRRRPASGRRRPASSMRARPAAKPPRNSRLSCCRAIGSWKR